MILESRREILNEEFAYLLGLISANSELDLNNRILIIDLFRQTANRGTKYEGFYYNPEISDYKISQFYAHERDVKRIKEKLLDLKNITGSKDEIESRHIDTYHFQIIIRFDSDSKIFKELKKYKFNNHVKKIIPFIPESIIKTDNRNIIISFLRGYCDLKSRISASDGIYKIVNGKKIFYTLRLGISIPHNTPELIDLFHKLFDKIGITKGISYTDPAKRKIREYLIRIDVRYVPYDLIGTHWRRIFLRDFINYLNKHRKRVVEH